VIEATKEPGKEIVAAEAVGVPGIKVPLTDKVSPTRRHIKSTPNGVPKPVKDGVYLTQFVIVPAGPGNCPKVAASPTFVPAAKEVILLLAILIAPDIVPPDSGK
jgi:hypothetical protein